MKIDAVRSLALSLPHTTQEPHHQFSSFCVDGKIFFTVPPDEEHIHVFVSEEHREIALAVAAGTEKLLWGGKVVGVRVSLRNAKPDIVETLVRQAYEFKRKASSRAKRHKPSAA